MKQVRSITRSRQKRLATTSLPRLCADWIEKISFKVEKTFLYREKKFVLPFMSRLGRTKSCFKTLFKGIKCRERYGDPYLKDKL